MDKRRAVKYSSRTCGFLFLAGLVLGPIMVCASFSADDPVLILVLFLGGFALMAILTSVWGGLAAVLAALGIFFTDD